MNELSMFGFPIVFNADNKMLIPNAEDISYEAYNRKYSEAMLGLLSDKNYYKKDDIFYDFYKSIGRNNEREIFNTHGLRYDSTVIMSGCAGNEFKKTAGHFHCEIPGKKVSYPEYYQVIKGKAVFVMQKVDYEHTPGRMNVLDCIVAEVAAGQAIVIPPNYGHCTVNVSNETMVFSNLVAIDSKNFYDSVRHSFGMCCYIKKAVNNSYSIEKNDNYDFSCEPKLVTPIENITLGILSNQPVYNEFLHSPQKFNYLLDPENNMKDFFNVFITK